MKPSENILQLTRCGIEAAGGLDTCRPVGVALSGGADSVALLSLLVSLGYRCVALHCNFHLRGAESDRDERHASSIAGALGTPLEIAHMDVPERRKLTRESIEMACRSLRYEWFGEKARDLGLQAIAVAHHRDDQIETFFLNLLRGSGARGLAAMKPRNGIIVRPLLGVSRDQIERYLNDKGLHYVTDSTNHSDEFRRNRLRNRVIPLINELFPGASDAITRSVNNLRGQARLLDQAADYFRDRYMNADGSIALEPLIDGEPHPSEVLYELLSPMGLNRSTTDDIIRSHASSGREFRGKSCRYRLERGVLKPLGADTPATVSPIAPDIISEVIPRGDIATLRCPPDTLLLDAKALDGQPAWEWRTWREGDRISPFGMRGSRLLSDIYSDLHLPLERRMTQPILTRDGKILWIPGIRASRHFPVTKTTETVLRLTYRPPQKADGIVKHSTRINDDEARESQSR